MLGAWRAGAPKYPPVFLNRNSFEIEVLLSTACPTSLASEPNHSGRVAGCTDSASVHGATPSGAALGVKIHYFVFVWRVGT